METTVKCEDREREGREREDSIQCYLVNCTDVRTFSHFLKLENKLSMFQSEQLI